MGVEPLRSEVTLDEELGIHAYTAGPGRDPLDVIWLSGRRLFGAFVKRRTAAGTARLLLPYGLPRHALLGKVRGYPAFPVTYEPGQRPDGEEAGFPLWWQRCSGEGLELAMGPHAYAGFLPAPARAICRIDERLVVAAGGAGAVRTYEVSEQTQVREVMPIGPSRPEGLTCFHEEIFFVHEGQLMRADPWTWENRQVQPGHQVAEHGLLGTHEHLWVVTLDGRLLLLDTYGRSREVARVPHLSRLLGEAEGHLFMLEPAGTDRKGPAPARILVHRVDDVGPPWPLLVLPPAARDVKLLDLGDTGGLYWTEDPQEPEGAASVLREGRLSRFLHRTPVPPRPTLLELAARGRDDASRARVIPG